MPSERDIANAALARWDGFPVDREPRPIVLTELDATALDRLSADREWRMIFDGPAVPESALPPELVPPAIAYCRDVMTGEQRPLAPVIHADGPFGTDRGRQFLPAWMMYPDNRRWPFVELDPGFRRERTWCPPGLRLDSAEESALAADGQTLTYRFMGAPEAYADYHDARVYETAKAVCVIPVAVSFSEPGDVEPAYAERREVVVHLSAPLGNRVLVAAGRLPDSDMFASPQPVIVAEAAG